MYYGVLRGIANLSSSLDENDPPGAGEVPVYDTPPDLMVEYQKYWAAVAEAEAAGVLNPDGTVQVLPEEEIDPELTPEELAEESP